MTKKNTVQTKLAVKYLINALMSRADVYYFTSRYKNAYEDLKTVMKITKEIDDRKSYALCLIMSSDFSVATSSFEAGLSYARQAYNRYRIMHDQGGMADALNKIGYVYSRFGNLKKAYEHYKKSLQFLKGKYDTDRLAQVLFNIGFIHSTWGNYKMAIHYYQRSRKICKNTGDLRGEASNLKDIGNLYYYLGNYRRALEYHHQGLQIDKKIGDEHNLANGLNTMGSIYNIMGDYASALKFCQDSLEIKRRIGNKDGQAFSLHAIGTIHQNLGQYDQARQYFNEALKIFRSISNIRGEGYTLHSIARNFLEQNENEEVDKYLGPAESIMKKLKDTGLGLRITFTHCDQELGRHNAMLAASYANQAYLLVKRTKSRVNKAQLILLQARIAAAQGRNKKAAVKFQQAIQSFKNLGQAYDLAKAYHYYADFLTTGNKKRKAALFRKKSQKIISKIRNFTVT